MGGAAKLMDPYNIEDMAEAMHIGLTDNQLRASLIEKGKQRARDFSWQEAARKTLAAYKTVNEADW
jgi:glycosyltransferase involved in cell wall biosynthesis